MYPRGLTTGHIGMLRPLAPFRAGAARWRIFPGVVRRPFAMQHRTNQCARNRHNLEWRITITRKNGPNAGRLCRPQRENTRETPHSPRQFSFGCAPQRAGWRAARSYVQALPRMSRPERQVACARFILHVHKRPPSGERDSPSPQALPVFPTRRCTIAGLFGQTSDDKCMRPVHQNRHVFSDVSKPVRLETVISWLVSVHLPHLNVLF